MSELFSGRYGYKSHYVALQYERMDENLSMSIYNALYNYLGEYDRQSIAESVCRDIWAEHWHLALDMFPNHYWSFYEEMKGRILNGQWYEPYDLIEYIADDIEGRSARLPGQQSVANLAGDRLSPINAFRDAINYTLKRESSGYRMIGGCITPITNEVEIQAIEQCLNAPDAFSGVRMHLHNAINHLAKKPDPDLNNAIKEAILAVESASRVAVDSETYTLSEALKALRSDGKLHPALIDGWNKIYGFTSDEDGIRHASNSDEVKVDFRMAKYMLVSCSAFSNYLIELY